MESTNLGEIGRGWAWMQSDFFMLIATGLKVTLLIAAGWMGGKWVRRAILKTARKLAFDEILWG
jgi:hypothetical protein